MKILVCSSRPYDQSFLEAANRNKHENPACIRLGMDYMPLEGLLKDSDIVSLHTPLTPETRHMINKESLSRKMEPCWSIPAAGRWSAPMR